MKHVVKVGSEFQMRLHMIADFEPLDTVRVLLAYDVDAVQLLEVVAQKGNTVSDHNGDLQGNLRPVEVITDAFKAGYSKDWLTFRFRALQPRETAAIRITQLEYTVPPKYSGVEQNIVQDEISIADKDVPSDPTKPKATLEARFEFVKEE